MNSFTTPTLPLLPPSRFKRWLATISAVLLTTLGLTAIAPAAQAAPTEATATVFSVPGWDYANVRSGPSTDKAVVKTIPAGSTVTLGCSTRGGKATGPYGTSDLWYKVAGSDSYIADVMILTGSDEAVTEACGQPQGPAQQYNRQRAVAWAQAHVYSEPTFKGNGAGDCTWFASQTLWEGGLPKTAEWTSDNAPFSLHPPKAGWSTDDFKNYLVNSGLATISELSLKQNAVPEAQPGDVILYDYSKDGALPDGIVDHAVVITGFSGQYPLVSGHSIPVSNLGWTYSKVSHTWLDVAHPNTRAYLIHITY